MSRQRADRYPRRVEDEARAWATARHYRIEAAVARALRDERIPARVPRADEADAEPPAQWDPERAIVTTRRYVEQVATREEAEARCGRYGRAVASYVDGVLAGYTVEKPALLGVRPPWVDETIDGWAADAAALIVRIEAEQVDGVAATIRRAHAEGWGRGRIAAEIVQQGAASRWRAAFWARDQIATVNGRITEQRQIEVGVRLYRWRTALDERVRDLHVEREGRVFAWAEPPSDEKIDGHPGRPINCRCTAEPIFADEEADIDAAEFWSQPGADAFAAAKAAEAAAKAAAEEQAAAAAAEAEARAAAEAAQAAAAAEAAAKAAAEKKAAAKAAAAAKKAAKKAAAEAEAAAKAEAEAQAQAQAATAAKEAAAKEAGPKIVALLAEAKKRAHHAWVRADLAVFSLTSTPPEIGEGEAKIEDAHARLASARAAYAEAEALDAASFGIAGLAHPDTHAAVEAAYDAAEAAIAKAEQRLAEAEAARAAAKAASAAAKPAWNWAKYEEATALLKDASKDLQILGTIAGKLELATTPDAQKPHIKALNLRREQIRIALDAARGLTDALLAAATRPDHHAAEKKLRAEIARIEGEAAKIVGAAEALAAKTAAAAAAQAAAPPPPAAAATPPPAAVAPDAPAEVRMAAREIERHAADIESWVEDQNSAIKREDAYGAREILRSAEQSLAAAYRDLLDAEAAAGPAPTAAIRERVGQLRGTVEAMRAAANDASRRERKGAFQRPSPTDEQYRWRASLPRETDEIVRDWGQSGYKQIRAQEAAGDFRSNDIARRSAALQQLIATAPKNTAPIHRGFNLPASVAAQFVPGYEYNERSTSSWSHDIEVAQGFSGSTGVNTTAVILRSANGGGAQIHSLGFHLIESEAELLTPRNTKFRVVSVKKKGSRLLVDVEFL